MATDSSCSCVHGWFSGSGTDCSLLTSYTILGHGPCFLYYKILCCRAYSLVCMLRVVTSWSISFELTKIHSFTLGDNSIATSWCHNKAARTCCSCWCRGIDCIPRYAMLTSPWGEAPVVICIICLSLSCSWLLSCRGYPLSPMSWNTLLLEHVWSHSVIRATHACDCVGPGSGARNSSWTSFIVLNK
jgi:hypothetical protein